MKRLLFLSLFIITITCVAYSQEDNFTRANISGNFQLEGQSYKADSIIGAENVPEKVLSNAYFLFNYRIQGFTIGLRYESYNNPINGFDPRYKGSGIAYKSINYANEFIDVTAGNFYEQFGSGMLLRAYEERLLGYDNSLDGARVKLTPTKGIEFTALIGKQRSFWAESDGLVRGGNLDLAVNDLITGFLPENLFLTLGASVVSRFQADNQSLYNLPLNVFAYSARFSLTHSLFSLNGEWGYKFNDPCASNKFNYNPGKGLYLSASYFPQGLGITLNFHRLDNMDFRTDRDAKGNNLSINYLPPLSKQQSYRLATLYPFATQLNGEMGFQADINYKLPSELFGDKYESTIALNYSQINSIDTTRIDKYTYDSKFFSFGKRLFFREINFEFIKKWNKTFETHFTVMNSTYDRDVMENEGSPRYGKVNATILVIEGLYKFTRTNALRVELQHAFATQDSTEKEQDTKEGNWIFGLAEYSIAPHWFLSIMDEYNYGNPSNELKIHYVNAGFTYSLNSVMINLYYGRQRGGLLCVGGVCRPVPASNGFRLSVTTSF